MKLWATGDNGDVVDEYTRTTTGDVCRYEPQNAWET